MSLADSFLEDLDELDNDDAENGLPGRESNENESDDDSEGDEEGDIDKTLATLVKAKVASAIGSLRKQNEYQRHMQRVQRSLNQVSQQSFHGLLEDDPEYSLILDCNRVVHQIDEELLETHRFIADVYAKKFPELEALISNKVEYVRTVQRIGNEMDLTLVELNDILSASAVMVVSVAGSATVGKPLSAADLEQVQVACDEVLHLVEDKTCNLQFVESRMSRLAPNLCALVGAAVGAQLVGLAGGIVALSKIPACNIQVMGQEKHGAGGRYSNIGGFSTAATIQHAGVLYQCDLVQSVPPAHRRKALKVVAGKVALVARVDSFQTPTTITTTNGGTVSTQGVRNSATGDRLRREVEEKLEKQLEPSKARTLKALPIPEEKKRSRRGGKRVRKMKERYAMTDIRQQHNRVSFTIEGGEYGDSSMGLDHGMVGHKDTGRLRMAQQKNTQQLAKKMKTKRATSNISSQQTGLQSSLMFTPVQGMELVNPNLAAERVKAANAKWFNTNSGFMSAAPLK